MFLLVYTKIIVNIYLTMLYKRNIYPSAILLVLLVVLTTKLYAGSSSNDGEISMFLIVTGLLGGLGMFL